jgi:hypothetical protein
MAELLCPNYGSGKPLPGVRRIEDPQGEEARASHSAFQAPGASPLAGGGRKAARRGSETDGIRNPEISQPEQATVVAAIDAADRPYRADIEIASAG